MEFWMTEKDDLREKDFMIRLRYYSYFDSNRYKVFPNLPGLDLVTHIGHRPVFPDSVKIKMSPKGFISRHYKFRSLEQGYRKIKRVRPPKSRPHQSFHYLRFKESPEWFIVPSSKLTLYNEDHKWNLERKFDGGRMSKEELKNYLYPRSELDRD